jgi:hypothetical protein
LDWRKRVFSEEAVQWAAGYALVERGLALFESAGFKFDRMVKEDGSLKRIFMQLFLWRIQKRKNCWSW